VTLAIGHWFAFSFTRSPFRVGMGIWSWGGWVRFGGTLWVFGPRADETRALDALLSALDESLSATR
jgi:hypothetical protein